MAARRRNPALEEWDVPEPWDFPEPRSLEERIKKAVGEFAPEADLDAMILMLTLVRVLKSMERDVETNVHRPSGTTWAAFRVLFTLRHAGPLMPMELAGLFSVSKASISSVLDTLERGGLITREASSDDGRSVYATLTDRGAEAAAELFWRQNLREIEWFRVLTPRERKTLMRLLGKLMANRPPAPARLPDRLPQLTPAPKRS
jgi:DNA-binding MarR family transcriptional regulator